MARIKYGSGVDSTVTKFLIECYVKPVARRMLSLLVIGMCMSVVFSEVGLMAGVSSPVAVLSRGECCPEASLPSSLVGFSSAKGLFFPIEEALHNLLAASTSRARSPGSARRPDRADALLPGLHLLRHDLRALPGKSPLTKISSNVST